MAIYYLCLDSNTPSGGRKVLYRHVDILNAAGIDAAVMHESANFRMTWFENNARVVGFDHPLTERDVLVIPETWGPQIHKLAPQQPFVIFNQNAYYTFGGYNFTESETPYRSENLLAVMTISEDSRQYLEYTWPGVKVQRVRWGLNDSLFHHAHTKNRVIAYMPRKHADEANQILNILKWRGELAGWAVKAIDGQPYEEVANILKESAIFMATGYPEGCPMPPAEAIACGCSVVGYTGRGADEYRDFYRQVISTGDIVSFARAMAHAMRDFEAYGQPRTSITQSMILLDRYSRQREEQDVIKFWEKTL